MLDFLLKNTTSFSLRQHQVRNVGHLLREFKTKQVACLNAITGDGKTIQWRYVAKTMLNNGRIKGVIILCHQLSVRTGWTATRLVGLPSSEDGLGHTHHIRDALELSDVLWVAPETTSKKWAGKLYLQQMTSDRPDHEAVAVSHALATRMGVPAGLDFSDRLMLVDESQFLGTETELYRKVIAPWLAAGGLVGLGTSTLWRTQGNLFLPDDVIPAVWTYAQQYKAGFAPRVKYRCQRYKGIKATNSKQLQGIKPYSGDPRERARQQAKWWATDDPKDEGIGGSRQKTITYTPTGSSTAISAVAYGQMLKEEYELQGARVFMSVGTANQAAKRMDDFVRSEEALMRKGKPSEYDVVLVCQRCQIGTNWPPATLVIAEGISFSLMLIAQRTGRLLRIKVLADGTVICFDYEPGTAYARHANLATVVFFVPEEGSAAENLLWDAKHREASLLLGSLMAGIETLDFLAVARDHGRLKRSSRGGTSGDKAKNEAEWDRILAIASMTRAEFGSFYRDTQWAALMIGSPTPGQDYDADLKSYLMLGMGKTEEDADKCLFVKSLVLAFQHLGIIKKLKADTTAGLFKGATTRTFVRDQFKKVFDEQADLLISMNQQFWEESNTILGALASEFTGGDTEIILKTLREGLPTKVITREHAIEAIHAYRKKHGCLPTTKSGHAGDYLHNWNITFKQINDQLRRHKLPTTLEQLGLRLYPPALNGKVKHQEAFEKFHQSNPKVLDRFIEGAIEHRDAGNQRCSIRQLDGKIRYGDGNHPYVDSNITSLYVRVITALLPALEGFFKTHTAKVFNPDWAALCIDPTDAKWDDYHVKAGGTLPRAMPVAKSDSQIAFEKFHNQNPSVLQRFIEVARDSDRSTVTLDFIYSQLRYDEDDPIPAKARNFPSYYNAVILGVASDLVGKLVQLRTKPVNIDWNALGYTPPNGKPPQIAPAKPKRPSPKVNTVNNVSILDFLGS